MLYNTNRCYGNECCNDSFAYNGSCARGDLGYNYLGNGLGNAAFGFVGDWVNIVVTMTVLQSILGLVCNWNCNSCGCGCGCGCDCGCGCSN